MLAMNIEPRFWLLNIILQSRKSEFLKKHLSPGPGQEKHYDDPRTSVV